MKKAKKITLIVAACLIVVGLMISFISVAVVGFDFAQFDTNDWKTNTYIIDESFENISIEGLEASVSLVPAADGVCKVVCTENDDVYNEIDVVNNTLTIKRIDNEKWHFNIGISMEESIITVYLPEAEYKKLSVDNSSGRIEVPEGFTFVEAKVANNSGKASFEADVKDALTVENTSGGVYVAENQVGSLKVSGSSGGIDIASVSVKDDMEVGNTSGGIRIQDVDCKNMMVKGSSGSIRVSSILAKGNIDARCSSGSIQMEDVECVSIDAENSSGSIKCDNVIASDEMMLRNSSGGISLEACDAANMRLSATSGSIRGSICSPKKFRADATSGSVDVPESSGDGVCEASTTSGSIKLSINE